MSEHCAGCVIHWFKLYFPQGVPKVTLGSVPEYCPSLDIFLNQKWTKVVCGESITETTVMGGQTGLTDPVREQVVCSALSSLLCSTQSLVVMHRGCWRLGVMCGEKENPGPTLQKMSTALQEPVSLSPDSSKILRHLWKEDELNCRLIWHRRIIMSVSSLAKSHPLSPTPLPFHHKCPIYFPFSVSIEFLFESSYWICLHFLTGKVLHVPVFFKFFIPLSFVS